jgi:hypothetical protein
LQMFERRDLDTVKHLPLKYWCTFQLDSKRTLFDYGTVSTAQHPVAERVIGVVNGNLAMSYNRELFIMRRLVNYTVQVQVERMLDAKPTDWVKNGLMIRTVHGGIKQ